MARQYPIFNLRIPPELKEQIEIRAKSSGRSVTAEILKAIEAHLNKQSPLVMNMSIAEQLTELSQRVSELEQQK